VTGSDEGLPFLSIIYLTFPIYNRLIEEDKGTQQNKNIAPVGRSNFTNQKSPVPIALYFLSFGNNQEEEFFKRSIDSKQIISKNTEYPKFRKNGKQKIL
jgi:hypothetical protein